MATLRKDELNILERNKVAINTSNSKKRGIPFATYFGVMGLTDKELEKRISLASDIEDAILFLYALSQEESVTPSLKENTMRSELLNIFGSQAEIDEYVEELTDKYAKGIANSKDLAKDPSDMATAIAEDVANAYANYQQFADAKRQGYKYKTWKSEEDDKVRKTHTVADGTKIPIDDTFKVGGSLMRFPTDDYYGATDDEIINCRCHLEYS